MSQEKLPLWRDLVPAPIVPLAMLQIHLSAPPVLLENIRMNMLAYVKSVPWAFCTNGGFKNLFTVRSGENSAR